MRSALPFGLIFALAILATANAGDWPQILGPGRNGVAVDERIADSWPAAGPALVWRRDVGSGFAGVSVSNATAILYHRVGDEEIVEAMHASSGKTLWK
jgi:hypothetical protein